MSEEFKSLLVKIKSGDAEAINTLTEIAYLKIKEISTSERDKHLNGANTSYITTTRTDLAHEVYCNLLDGGKLKDLSTEKEFYTLIKNAVKLNLVTQQNQINAKKRNAYDKISIDTAEARDMIFEDDGFIDIISLEKGLLKLREESEEHVDIIELKFYIRMSDKEIARILGVSVRTVQSKLAYARVWLKDFVT